MISNPSRRVRVQSLDHRVATLDENGYDLLVGALGYEARSTFLPTEFAAQCRRVLLLGFPDNHVLSFPSNMEVARRCGFEVIEADEIEFETQVRKAFAGIREEATAHWQNRVLVDVSSMTRGRIARAFAAARDELPLGTTVDVAYAPAEFTTKLYDDGPVTEMGPLPHFAGWSGSPDVELGMVLGLGFESHLALGVVETHEPADIWAFVPSGVDQRYDRRVREANALLFENIQPSRIVTYDVMQPYACAQAIQGVLRATLASHRMMLVPLGSKSFCIAALTVAMAYEGRLNAWRVSAGAQRLPVDRRPVGTMAAIRFRLELRAEPDLEGVGGWDSSPPGKGVSARLAKSL